MKKKTVIWFVIFLLVIIGTGVGYFTFLKTSGAQAQAANDAETIQTASARIGDLSIFASGSGQIVANAETALGFDELGELLELLVATGDQVKTGDVLARLQTYDTSTQINANIASAELAVLKAQQNLDALYENAEMERAEALLALEDAQSALDETLDYSQEQAQAMQAVASAQDSIENLDMTLYIYNSVPSEQGIDTVYASLVIMTKEYNELVDRYERIKYRIKAATNKIERDRYKQQLLRLTPQYLNKKIEYEEALYHYDTLLDPANPVEVGVAEAQMNTAQVELEQATQDLAVAQEGPPPGDVALAKANLAEAQATWDQLKDGPDVEAVSLAEKQLANAEMKLSLLQQEQTIVELIAPIDGTVISIDAAVGEQIEGQDIITLADVSQMLLEVYLDETDFDKIQVGYPVEVVFDALPDDQFNGEIIEIDPALQTSFNSTVIRAMALLDEASYGKPMSLPLGLNASVDVIAGQAEGVVIIPVEALQKDGQDDYFVYVQNDTGFEVRPVEVGLMDYTSAEIVSGLSAGEVVAIENMETRTGQ